METYTLTIKQIQALIHFFADKEIRADKIKGYLNVSKSNC